MSFQHWKVVIRYGHVGIRNEISVARHLVFESSKGISEIMDFVAEMPGTKKIRSYRLRKYHLRSIYWAPEKSGKIFI